MGWSQLDFPIRSVGNDKASQLVKSVVGPSLFQVSALVPLIDRVHEWVVEVYKGIFDVSELDSLFHAVPDSIMAGFCLHVAIVPCFFDAPQTSSC
jgi:hypothetical protein